MVVAEKADWVVDRDLERVVMGWELAGGVVEVGCGADGPVVFWAVRFEPGVCVGWWDG